MRIPKPLIWQLFPSYLLITLLSLFAVGWYSVRSLEPFFLTQTAADLEARAKLLERQILPYLAPLNTAAVDRLTKQSGIASATRITVILPSGRVIGDTLENPVAMDNHANRPEIVSALAGVVGSSVRFSRTLKQKMMYVAIPVRMNQQTAAVLRASFPITFVDQAISSIRIKIVLAGAVVALLAAGISLIVSRRITHPIQEMKNSAEDFARGNLDHRLEAPASAEMAGLANALNRMAAELDNRITTIIRQRNELETVLSSMREGVIAVDLEERIISMNQAAARVFEGEVSRFEGRSLQEVIRNVAMQRFVHKALRSPSALEDDISVYQAGERVLNVHSSPMLDGNQKHIGTLVVFNDATQMRRLESMRRDFVANVSHEIKTPLTAIKGFVETLHQGRVDSPEEIERFLGIIMKHVNRLNSIIEDLLSLSRIEQEDQRKEITLKKGFIQKVIQTAIQVCQARADAKRIAIELGCPPELTAQFDATLLEQAFVNLLDNAVKFSPENSRIRIEAGSMNSEVFVRFTDQGPGIPQIHLPRLFERFYRVDKARSRKLGGTGLGLAIVKHIVQAHGGQVSVESTVGAGTTFSVHLPGS